MKISISTTSENVLCGVAVQFAWQTVLFSLVAIAGIPVVALNAVFNAVLMPFYAVLFVNKEFWLYTSSV